MSASAYYDHVLSKEQAKQILQKAGGIHAPSRSKPGIVVYKLRGDGEAMLEAADGDNVRVRLFHGKCAC